MEIRQRDGMGRFTNGNPGGPGRPRRKVEEEYLASMETIVDVEAWQQIVKRATIDAIAGDAKARSWLSGYLMGMPISRTEEVPATNAIDEALARMQEMENEQNEIERMMSRRQTG